MNNKEITVFGLGAIGSNVAYNLLQAEPRLVLNGVDKDVVEQRNLGNQIYSQPFVGQPKTDAFVAEVYMRTQSMPKGKLVKGEASAEKGKFIYPLIKSSSLVIDAFDNFESRDFLHTAVSINNPRAVIVHLGFGVIDKSLFGTVQWNAAYQLGQTDAPGQDVCELPDAGWWIKGATALMTKNVLDFLRNGKVGNILIRPDLSVKIL